MAWTRRKTLRPRAVSAGAGLLIALATALAIAGNTAVADGEPAGCSATARIDSQWGAGAGGGQTVAVAITNTGSTPATRWTASWTVAGGQSVVSAWNATLSTSGSTVTAVNAAYNGSLAPGASTSFGMQLSGVAPAPVLSCANDASVPVTPSTSPSNGADVTVTEIDSQRTVTLAVGQALSVALPQQYRPTSANGSALVRVSTSGGYPTGQPLVELYRAAAPGAADLTSQTDHPCLHTTPPCAMPVKLWRVHVIVTSPGDLPPVVELTSPNSTSIYGQPGTIQLAATASDPDGTITKVEFSTAPYAGTPFTLVAADTTAPYSYQLIVPAANVFVIQAKAYDDAGQTATDTVRIRVAVSDPPPPSPTPSSDIHRIRGDSKS